MIARIDAIGVADARQAGAALLASAPTVASVGPRRGVPTPDMVAARLRRPALAA